MTLIKSFQGNVANLNYFPSKGHSQAAPRTPLESPCLATSTGVSASLPKTYSFSRPGTLRYSRGTCDTPPPKTKTSGSRMFTILARLRVSRSSYRSRQAVAAASPASMRSTISFPAASTPVVLPVIRFEPRPGNPCFEAAAVPAITWFSGIFLGAHPGQRGVSPFAGNAVAPVVHPPVKRDASTATGSEDHRKHHSLPRARAVGRFRNGQAVRVIRAANFPAQCGGQIAVKRPAVQPGRVCDFSHFS